MQRNTISSLEKVASPLTMNFLDLNKKYGIIIGINIKMSEFSCHARENLLPEYEIYKTKLIESEELINLIDQQILQLNSDSIQCNLITAKYKQYTKD